jgi:glycosyltransferase involved in cell wall biosynthesis
MRILQINKFNFAQGGADRYYLELSALLREQGHEVANFAMASRAQTQTSRGLTRISEWEKYFVSYVDFSLRHAFLRQPINIFKAIGRTFWSFAAAHKLSKLIRAFRPDVAHVHNIYHQLSVSVLWVLKKNKIPVVMTVHDWNLISCNYVRYHHGRTCSHTIDGKFWRAVTNKCVKDSYLASAIEALAHYFHKGLRVYERYVACFIFPSKFLAHEYIRAGFKMRQQVVLSNYVASSSVTKDHDGERYMVYVGRLSEEKGLATLLTTLKFIEQNIKLKIVGAGPLFEHYKLQATNYKLRDKVEFLGHKNQAQTIKLIKNSLFMVFPSQALENQPLVLLEAMAQGVPVIASRSGGVSEIVADGKTGLLFEPGKASELTEKISRLLNDDELRSRLGKDAQAQAYKYSATEHYRHLRDIYDRLVKNS